MYKRHECTVHEKGNAIDYQEHKMELNFTDGHKRNGNKTVKRYRFSPIILSKIQKHIISCPNKSVGNSLSRFGRKHTLELFL